MGKNIIQQARGKGGPTYRAPSFRYVGVARHKSFSKKEVKGQVIDIMTCQGHSTPLVLIDYEDKESCLMLAPHGIKVGDSVSSGGKTLNNVGDTLALKDIPEGTFIYNIESKPGDGGKFCRASGAFARVASKSGNKIIIILPSKKQKICEAECRATIGMAAGSGRKEKPFGKAGKRHYQMKAKNKLYPLVSGGAVNAVDHPFGNKRSSRKSKAKPCSKNAPPGRKVGMVGARRTGRRKK